MYYLYCTYEAFNNGEGLLKINLYFIICLSWISRSMCYVRLQTCESLKHEGSGD